MPIRTPSPAELELLREIQLAAGAAFATIGMAEIANNDPTPVDDLLRLREAGLLWVDIDEQDRPIAFLAARRIDAGLHIDQVSVHPSKAGLRIGLGLINQVGALFGLPLTLTTFAQVPWNAPYYERCGFRPLSNLELSTDLASIHAEETASLPPRWPRVVMRRTVR